MWNEPAGRLESDQMKKKKRNERFYQIEYEFHFRLDIKLDASVQPNT